MSRSPRNRASLQSLAPLALLAALLATLALASVAAASSTTKILETCSEGKIPKGYSQQAYRQALKQMPSELSEYSDCPSLIHKAQLDAVGPGGGGSGPGTGASGGAEATVAPPSAAEQHTLENSTHSGGGPVSVGGETLHPGVVHANIASALSSLPTPIVALLAFLLLCAVLIVGWALRDRLPVRRLRHTAQPGA